MPNAKLVRKERGDLAVTDTLDRQLYVRPAPGWRCDRVAALCLIAIICGQAYIDVLPCQVPGPCRGLKRDAFDRGRLLAKDRGGRDLPIAAYRRTDHSIARVPLLPPGIAVDVIAKRLPEPRGIRLHEHQSPDPFCAFPEIQMWHEQSCGAAVFGWQRQSVKMRGYHGFFVNQV